MQNRKPPWLRVKIPRTGKNRAVRRMLSRLSLHTVCEEANCPNLMECFGRNTATFMILGRICSRNCAFCNVEKGIPEAVDPGEPARVAEAAQELGLKHVVITSVTRDDLPDGGAGHFARVIGALKDTGMVTEVLIPDFQGDVDALRTVVEARPHIINHNVETVPRLYPAVRPKARYQRSLEVLENAKRLDGRVFTKSGLMLGLGERREEVIEVMRALRAAGCDLLTIGQYLAPSTRHHPVVEYCPPDEFEKYGEIGYQMGFKHVASAPLVRSSYRAADVDAVIGI